MQIAVTAHLEIKQLLPYGFARQSVLHILKYNNPGLPPL